ncbi:MAG: glutamate 5-kinase [Bacteroidales bacterium]|nr:glutamate 5-kinase [Bacteroidales bacterium]
MEHRELLKNKQRIIIKIGTALITHTDGKINLIRLEKFARVIAGLRNEGREIILVTSGAVGSGIGILDMENEPVDIIEKQALASVGQAALLRMYETFFKEYNQIIGQVLLTRDGIDHPVRKNNAKNAIEKLLAMGVTPVINENDVVSTEEIEFGDNDMLSAMVAELVSAGLLIILTTTNGVYTDNPKTNSDAKQVPKVMKAGNDLKDVVTEGKSEMGSGGMRSKIDAAELCRQKNIDVVIADGTDANVIYEILNGSEHGTHFVSRSTDLKSD